MLVGFSFTVLTCPVAQAVELLDSQRRHAAASALQDAGGALMRYYAGVSALDKG